MNLTIDQMIARVIDNADPVQVVAAATGILESFRGLSPACLAQSPFGGPRVGRGQPQEGERVESPRIRYTDLKWNLRAEHEIVELCREAGLSVDVKFIDLDDLHFNQGELETDEPRRLRLVNAVQNHKPIPPFIVTKDEMDGEPYWTMLDGHHRVMAIVTGLWPPYPPVRCIILQNKDGSPFFWKQNQDLKHAIPSYG